MDVEKEKVRTFEWLLISYYSLEDSLIGGLRIDRLNKYLLSQGIKSKIITRQSSTENDVMLKEPKFLSIIGKFLRLFLVPDYSIIWAYKVYQYLKNDSNKIIFSTSPPHGIHVSGLLLKSTNKNFFWIIDFRDPWIQNVLYRPPFLKGFINKKIEQTYLRKADLVIFNTETDLKHYQSIFPWLNGKSISVKNGFDKIVPNSSNDSELKIVYSGGAYKGDATKSIIDFITKINSTKSLNIQLDYYGEYSNVIEGSKEIHFKGKISQESVPTMLSNYKFGLAYMPKESINSGRVLQKFYDYLGSGVIPIVINPSQEMVYIMDELGCGIKVYEDSNYDYIVNQIIEQKKINIVNNKILERYSREGQFKKILDYLEIR